MLFGVSITESIMTKVGLKKLDEGNDEQEEVQTTDISNKEANESVPQLNCVTATDTKPHNQRCELYPFRFPSWSLPSPGAYITQMCCWCIPFSTKSDTETQLEQRNMCVTDASSTTTSVDLMVAENPNLAFITFFTLTFMLTFPLIFSTAFILCFFLFFGIVFMLSVTLAFGCAMCASLLLCSIIPGHQIPSVLLPCLNPQWWMKAMCRLANQPQLCTMFSVAYRYFPSYLWNNMLVNRLLFQN